jgi:hypothetical protein
VVERWLFLAEAKSEKNDVKLLLLNNKS